MADEPFAAAEIRRLDELRLRAAESAIDVDLAAGRHAEVIGELERLVAEQPLREHLHAQHMLALYRAGRQADALAAYRDARSELVDQIGVEPGAELRQLQDAILAQDSALDVREPATPIEPTASPRPPPRSPAKRLLVGAAAVLLAGVTAFGIIRVVEPEGLSGIGENWVGLIDPDGGRITEQYPVGRSPSAVIGGGGSVWIANAAEGTVSRIPRKGDQVVTIDVGGAPAALAFGGGSLWVADGDSREVAQVDPGANKVLQRIPVGNAPRALAATAGAIWVASSVDGRIQRIDIARGRVTLSIATGANPSAIVAAAGALWVASEEAGTVTRVDPRARTIVETIPVGNAPSALAAGEGAVWVVNRSDGRLSRIDPATNSVAWAFRVGGDPTAVAAGNGSVWVAGGEDGSVLRVDPDAPLVTETVRTGNSPAAIAATDGSVWAAATAPQAAHRGGTLRMLVPDIAPSVPIDSLHPYAYMTPHTFQLSSLAYDGLVAYRRVEGTGGGTLVGALATKVPRPGRHGSYVFTLRPGLRFSDGRPVRPEDFRASMERFLQATRDYPPEKSFPEYADIVGARRCMDGKARCDLSRGIVTNSRARTITIHLTRPDGEFLHKLTVAWASVVPAGSPISATTGRTPPGTGPYRVAAWDMRRGGLLVRNPYFGSGPARSRPPGFADRIEVGFRQVKDIEEQIAEVQRGSADLAVVANTFVSFVSADRLEALVTRSHGRVHSNPATTTEWMFLNTRRRPFDDLGVRQAVNLAYDRARMVQLSGGPEVGQPACQVVPPAFPGYEPYCPYTTQPSGGWSGLDFERARRLIAASGRAGERVVVQVPDYQRAAGRYFTGLLDRLGFRATLNMQRNEDYDIYEAGSRAQTGVASWGADYLSPSTFIDFFSCGPDGKTENLSRLCDRKLERLSERALATPPGDANAAWAAAGRRLTDVAAAVPMTTRRSVVLVSERVGNVTNHAQWFTLLDQLWVR